jgi:tetratricopeptide (TPR) repeat protein
MKKIFFSLSLAIAVAGASFAQRVPQASTSAGITQTVGITDFKINYSRPSLKGRAVFQENSPLAPYNQLWRTGANMASTLEANTEFSFGGIKVPAGKYAIFSIPSGTQWTVILNKNSNQGGTDQYKQTEDVARILVTPTSSLFHETFTLGFSDITNNTAYLNISWGAITVPVPISLDTETLTLSGLNKTLAEKPEDIPTLQSTSAYLLSTGKDLPQALSLADKAIGLKESVGNLWLKAQILNKMGKVAEALPIAQKALSLGASGNGGAFPDYLKSQIETSISGMQSKIPAVKEAVKAVKGKKK